MNKNNNLSPKDLENCIIARDKIIGLIGFGDIEESLAKLINYVSTTIFKK